MSFGSGPERILINLDAHPDRTLGVRAMDCSVIAHEKTAQVFRNRPSTFKVPSDETGADWENIPGLAGIRWVAPEISFTHTMTLQWEDTPILLESHPGPSAGAIWVICRKRKLPSWAMPCSKTSRPSWPTQTCLPGLKRWHSCKANHIAITPWSAGAVEWSHLRLSKAKRISLRISTKKLEKLSQKRPKVDVEGSLAQQFLSSFKVPTARQKQYAQRLRYGLKHYYVRHYQSESSNNE